MSAQLKSADEIEVFRRDTRAWLEANCPAEMRQPVVDESDVCWGVRHVKFKNDAQRVWLERMAERGVEYRPDARAPLGYAASGRLRAGPG